MFQLSHLDLVTISKQNQVTLSQLHTVISVGHTPLSDFEGKALDLWLIVVTGEVNINFGVTADQAKRGDVLCHDGVLVGNSALVCLNGERHTRTSNSPSCTFDI